MMKKLIYLVLFLLYGLTSYSQNISRGGEDNSKPLINVTKNYYDIANLNGKVLFLTSDPETSTRPFSMVHPSKPRTSFVYLEAARRVKLQLSIAKGSIKNYKYTVIENDSVYLAKDLSPKSTNLSSFNTLKTDLYEFGPYALSHKKVSFFIYEVGRKERGREVIIYGKRLNPVELVEATIVDVYKDERLAKVAKTTKNGDSTTIITAYREARNLNIHGGAVPINPNFSYAQISIKPIDNIFLYKILIKRTDDDRTGFTPIDNLDWEFNATGNLECRLDIENFEKPGKYEVIIYPKTGNINVNKIKNATRINFVLTEPSLTIRQLGIYAVSGFLVLTGLFMAIVFIIKRRNKKKLLIEQQKKSLTQMQLNAVRSQLNPHFMFNALAGIQSLMNKNKTEEANEYLGKFARITRNVLDNQELTSLANEKALLEDYLQMEQFRFGFTFQIETANELDLENTEIPSMLLQPFVENAVKHGIADCGAEGEIIVFFKQEESNLILGVKDNGQGFDVAKEYQGLGLQLSKDRIALLNSIYKETPFTMEMTSNDKGTTIMITLFNWL